MGLQESGQRPHVLENVPKGMSAVRETAAAAAVAVHLMGEGNFPAELRNEQRPEIIVNALRRDELYAKLVEKYPRMFEGKDTHSAEVTSTLFRIATLMVVSGSSQPEVTLPPKVESSVVEGDQN